jgi:hypothetical protein
MSDNLTFLDQTEAQRVCERWQKILRLQDWQITTEICRSWNMPSGGATGTCQRVPARKVANIKILDGSDYSPDFHFDPNHEQTMVHELIHLHTYYIEPKAGADEFDPACAVHDSMEVLVDAMAGALLALDRQARGNPDLTYYRSEPNGRH